MPERQGLRAERTASGVDISAGDITIAAYVIDPDAPVAEAPKPYLHPIRTLSGAPLSVFRPSDHRWHKGLQMTLSDVSGENFWGGPTFSGDAGYVWKDNLGTVRHLGFADIADTEDFADIADIADSADGDVTLQERLEWIASSGERWFAEERIQRFWGADRERGLWVLDFTTDLRNVADRPLTIGSPTTLGRPSAGYTGLFWRGPRSWTGATIAAAGLQSGADAMGAVADWLALSSPHDERDGGATVLAIAGTSSAAAPIRWFVRAEPFAAIAPSPAFEDEIVLEPGAVLALRHRFVFIDHECDQAELQALGEEFAL